MDISNIPSPASSQLSPPPQTDRNGILQDFLKELKQGQNIGFINMLPSNLYKVSTLKTLIAQILYQKTLKVGQQNHKLEDQKQEIKQGHHQQQLLQNLRKDVRQLQYQILLNKRCIDPSTCSQKVKARHAPLLMQKCQKFKYMTSSYNKFKKSLQECQGLRLCPSKEQVVYSINKQIKEFISKNIPEILNFKLSRYQNQEQVQVKNQIKELQNQLIEALKQVSKGRETDFDPDQVEMYTINHYEFRKKLEKLKQKVKVLKIKLGLREFSGQNQKLLRIIIKSMIQVKSDLQLKDQLIDDEEEQDDNDAQEISENSKFIIQPINCTKNFIVYDLETKSKKKYSSQYKFPDWGMGFVHLSNSLVVTGGRTQSQEYFRDARRIYDNSTCISLPKMHVRKTNFPLVQFRDGKLIASICGSCKQQALKSCEKMEKFKKWEFLPQTNFELFNRSACSVPPNTIYAFGGHNFQNNSYGGVVESLNLGNQQNKWIMIQLWPNVFQKRSADGACYLQNEKKLIVFGNANNQNGTIEMKVNEDFLELQHFSNLQFPEYNAFYFPTLKIYKEKIYCFNGNRDKLFRYELKDRKWESYDSW